MISKYRCQVYHVREEKSEEGKSKSVCIRDKLGILNCREKRCLTEGATFEKGEEANFIDN